MRTFLLNFSEQLLTQPEEARVPWVKLFFVFWLVLGVSLLGFTLKLPPNTLAHGITIEGIGVSGLTKTQAEEKLRKVSFSPSQDAQILLQADGFQTATQAATLGLHGNLTESVERAYQIGRTGSSKQQLLERLRLRWQPRTVPLVWEYDEKQLRNWILTSTKQLQQEGRDPSATLVRGEINIDEGKFGQRVRVDDLIRTISLKPNEPLTLQIPLEVTHLPLSSDGQILGQRRLQKLKNISFTLEVNKETVSKKLTPETYFPWLRLPDGFFTATAAAGLTELTQAWNKEPQNAIFTLSPDGKTLSAFQPHETGKRVEVEELTQTWQTRINQLEIDVPASVAATLTQITVPIVEQQPEISLGDTNTLGIQERLGFGTSKFQGSIPNRVYNVKITSERVHAHVVYPGEEFSFNEAVGEISARTGYKTAYVIRNGRTELGDGGGVCQVSTTIFRAALNAGFPITKWKPHSYRVGYYEQEAQPGFDATVYAPTADLRFKNDSKHALVVASYLDEENRFLKIELWGTKDGRTAEIKDYKIWNQRSAPAPLFVDDYNIPTGQRKQIDWAAPGASTSFHYLVKSENGEVLHEKTFVSNFRPWQAVYLVGRQ